MCELKTFTWIFLISVSSAKDKKMFTVKIYFKPESWYGNNFVKYNSATLAHLALHELSPKTGIPEKVFQSEQSFIQKRLKILFFFFEKFLLNHMNRWFLRCERTFKRFSRHRFHTIIHRWREQTNRKICFRFFLFLNDQN